MNKSECMHFKHANYTFTTFFANLFAMKSPFNRVGGT